MKILWIKSDLLHPLTRGGRIRTYGILRVLKRRHAITYLTSDGDAGAERLVKAAEYADRVEVVPRVVAPRGTVRFALGAVGNLFSRFPYSLARYDSPTLRAAVEKLVRREQYDLIVCDFLTPWPSLATLSDRPPVVLFEHNVEVRIWERHAAVSRNPLMRAYFALQARRMHRIEGTAVRQADQVIAVSEADAVVLSERFGVKNVAWVATGVDTDYFQPTRSEHEESGELVFVGSMDWMPNEDGVRWFVHEVLPLLRARWPDARLSVVGRDPSAGIRRVADRAGGVIVTGRVRDIRPFLARAAVAVVPLRIAGGTRMKIYEAMACGIPVVSTSIGAEGLEVSHRRDIMLADGAEHFAEAVSELLASETLRRDLARRARCLVEERFGWEQVGGQFAEICEHVAARNGRGESGHA